MHQFKATKKGRQKIQSNNAQLWLSIFLILFGLHLCSGLTSENRSELARKFKYYHQSVRPGDRFNLIDTINGTFFALHTEVELLQTRPIGNNKLEIELMLSLYFNDERLILRDIQDVITIPDEFSPWTPQLDFPDHTKIKSSIHVDPRTGQMSLRYKLHVHELECKNLEWTRPFTKNYCKFEVGTNDNEKIFPRIIRDLRTSSDIWEVRCVVEQFPTFAIACEYQNQWLPTVVKNYLPTILIFSIAAFSQWKRRKLQVLVTLCSLIGLLLLKTAKDQTDNFDMEDLFLLSSLMHIIALLGIDLVLPARRIIRTTYSNVNDKLPSSTNSNHATFSTRSTEKAPMVTASYKDATQRFLRPFELSNRSFLGSSEEKSVFLDMPSKLPPVHYDLSDIELADEEADEDDVDLQRMRTTFVHIRKPAPSIPTVLGTSFTNTSPSINTPSQKTQPASSLSASATTVVTSPTTAIVRRRTSEVNRSQHLVTKMTIGRKKRLALISIIGCYILFMIVYVFLVIYVLG